MAMQVGEHDAGEDVPMSDINTTPLVDVMLVLLIIFLITVPVVIQSVPITLPQVRNEPTETKPENVSLTVRGGPGGTCAVQQVLEEQIKRVGGIQNITEDNMPEVHIRGDINTPYKCIGGTVFTMQRAGFQRVGFISQPPPGGHVERL